MIKRKAPSKLPTPRNLSILLVLCVVVVIAFVMVTHRSTSGPAFVLPDKTTSQNEIQLCSPYANLCFTRPASWTRSSILHVNGSKNTTVEINPPTGTILEFAMPSKDTTVTCDKQAYKECIIKVSDVASGQNNNKVVTGMLISVPDANCMVACATPKYLPFVTLVSETDFKKYGLGNDASTFDSFSPTAQIKGGNYIYLQVTPGKTFSANDAAKWQTSLEAKEAQAILESVQPYN